MEVSGRLNASAVSPRKSFQSEVTVTRPLLGGLHLQSSSFEKEKFPTPAVNGTTMH